MTSRVTHLHSTSTSHAAAAPLHRPPPIDLNRLPSNVIIDIIADINGRPETRRRTTIHNNGRPTSEPRPPNHKVQHPAHGHNHAFRGPQERNCETKYFPIAFISAFMLTHPGDIVTQSVLHQAWYHQAKRISIFLSMPDKELNTTQ